MSRQHRAGHRLGIDLRAGGWTAGWTNGPDAEACGHVEFDFAVRENVLPKQGRQPAPVFGSEELGPLVFGEDILEHQRVHVHQGGLQNLQAHHGHLLFLSAVGRDLAAFAVVDDGVRAIERLDDVEAFGDLALQFAAA